LEWDWYPGTIPANATIHETAYVETSFSFYCFRGERADAVTYGRGASSYLGTMFDVGPQGRVSLGDYALVHGARIICDSEIHIGDHALISWNVVLMDTYRLPADASARRSELERVTGRQPRLLTSMEEPRPIHIGNNVWIGFDSCILPGVSIGEGSVVGAKSVVSQSVPPYAVAGGNPARIIRMLTAEEKNRDANITAA
jgi:acetyltransferase-like isoleucine patch superfamily enzyme